MVVANFGFQLGAITKKPCTGSQGGDYERVRQVVPPKKDCGDYQQRAGGDDPNPFGHRRSASISMATAASSVAGGKHFSSSHACTLILSGNSFWPFASAAIVRGSGIVTLPS